MATASGKNTTTTLSQREAKKRAAAAICQMQGTAKKKRVVLGDLTNVSRATAVAVSDIQPRKKIKLEKPVATVATPEKVDERSDPQLGGPYVSDIYEYLCGMEVLGFCSFFVSVFLVIETVSFWEWCEGFIFCVTLAQVLPSKRPLPDYIQKVQKDVNANMRGVLVDWLVEVAEEYKLVSDTLYFCVAYIDRFLSLNVLSRQRLQLLGVSAMLIAS